MDSVAVIPRRFQQPPFIISLPVALVQLGLWPLSTLQLMRGYAWLSGMNPLMWLILVGIYAGVCAVAVTVCMAWICHLKRDDPSKRIEAHIHPNLACFIYAILSLFTAAPAIMILSYYYAHYGGEAPLAKHAGDVTNAAERRDIWLSGHVMLSVSCLIGAFQYLSQVLTPSIVALRYTIFKDPSAEPVVTKKA